MAVRFCSAHDRAGALIAFLLVASPLAAQPTTPQTTTQTPTATFRSGVEYVEVDVTVLDRKGRLIRDLTVDDFELLEDGVPQTLDAARLVDIPLPPKPVKRRRGEPAPVAVEADVIRNPGLGRIFVMLLDTSSGDPLLRTRLVARRFVEEALGPDDLMAVIHLDSTAAAGQGFTSDKGRLLTAIDRFGTAAWFGAGEGPSVLEGSRATAGAYEMIQAVAERLGAVSGRRKSILWIGGAPQFHHTDFRQVNAAFAQRDAIRAATRNNVAIYPVDPRGLTIAFGMAELERQSGFRVMAEDTGGEAIVNTNNFSGNYRRIIEQNSTYYMLGYYPREPKDDGKFHKISVKVKRPGLRVRAKKGYTARRAALPALPEQPPTLRLSEATTAALRSPLPLGGITLDMILTPFRGEGRNATILLGAQLRGSDLRLDADSRIELAQVAIDMSGYLNSGAARLFTLDLAPRASDAEAGLRYFDRLALPPGRHEVRLVVHQPGGVTGSVVGDVDVPDYSRKALMMSGLVVASQHEGEARLLTRDARSTQALTTQPTIVRRFGPDDILTVWAELYDNRTAAALVLPIETRILTASGSKISTRERVLAPSDGDPRRFDYRDRIELSGLVPGDYVLEIATKPKGVKKPVRRLLPFTVE